MSRRTLLYVLSCALLATWASGTLQAGSVFMKNGYILQAPIMERADGTVVLGWPNGRVMIQSRFIESISYDPGEEKRLQDEENLRLERRTTGANEDPSLLPATNDLDDLPSTLEELMNSVQPKDPKGDPGDAVSPLPPTPVDLAGGPKPPEGTGTAVPVVVPMPEDRLGDKVSDGNLGLALRPPRNWVVKTSDRAFQASGPVSSEGYRSSLNLVALPRGALGKDEYVAALKEENARFLQGYEVLHEGPRDLGGRKAHEVVGQGTYQGRSAVVRQILVVSEDRVWLVSTFTQDKDAGGAFALTEESVKTIEFRAH